MASDETQVEVDGRSVRVSSPGKIVPKQEGEPVRAAPSRRRDPPERP